MVPRNHWKPLAVSDDFADVFSKNLTTYKTRKKTSNLTLKGAPTLVHQNKNLTLKRLEISRPGNERALSRVFRAHFSLDDDDLDLDT